MKDWHATLVAPASTIREALGTIDAGSLQIALVVDPERRLLGTVTDGDVRRALLKGFGLDSTVSQVMNRRPIVARAGSDPAQVMEAMRARSVTRTPLVDGQGQVTGLELLEDLIHPAERDNWVVLMAGGLGTRLRPLTDDCPKPMLPVGRRPLLETIIETFAEHGFRRFFVSVNYMAAIVKRHFGDGSRFGVRIEYLEERERLGTAGALRLLPERPTAPIFVMNGDLLTRVNFRHLLDFHVAERAQATMCVHEYAFQVPYGVVRTQRQHIVAFDEKPAQRFFINAGVYLIEPGALDLIPEGPFDMPSLFQLFMESGKAAAFPVREYWLDIGQLADYERANGDFKAQFR